MRGRLTYRNAVIAGIGATWAVWNLLSYELTVELAGIQDKWQPFLTLLRVIFPFMYFDAPFLPDWFSLVAFLLFPLAFLMIARFLAEEWSLKRGAIAGCVWAAAVGLSAVLSPHESQANRLYELARGDVGEALGSLIAIGVLEVVLVAGVLNAVVYYGARIAGPIIERARTKSAAKAAAKAAAEIEAGTEEA